MNTYEAIYNRKSVRKFSMTPFSEKILDRLRRCAEHLQRLDETIPTQVDILDMSENQVKLAGLFRVKAPYYLMISVDKSCPGAMLEAGYIAEQMVLYMTARGIGTCYQGGLRCLNQIAGHGLNQAILIAFGRSSEEIYRDQDKARRKKLSSLCMFREGISDEMRTLLKAACLAPSAFNRQPWRFVVYENRVYILAEKNMLNRKNSDGVDLDMGIMLCHLTLAAEEMWMEIELKKDGQLTEIKLKQYRYVMSMLKRQPVSGQ